MVLRANLLAVIIPVILSVIVFVRENAGTLLTKRKLSSNNNFKHFIYAIVLTHTIMFCLFFTQGMNAIFYEHGTVAGLFDKENGLFIKIGLLVSYFFVLYNI